MIFTYFLGIKSIMTYIWLILLIISLIGLAKTKSYKLSRIFKSLVVGTLFSFISVLFMFDIWLQVTLCAIVSTITYILLKNR